jgi:hypothetical protein
MRIGTQVAVAVMLPAPVMHYSTVGNCVTGYRTPNIDHCQ